MKEGHFKHYSSSVAAARVSGAHTCFPSMYHLLLQSYCSNSSQLNKLNALIAEFNTIKPIFGNKAALLRGSNNNIKMEMHMKSCFSLYRNLKVADRKGLIVSTTLLPTIS